mmetsp:Transcript_21406/g.54710  ORF Transcript_21406/g.54710 Transcript_21406/m.54710 type:complete len:247 (+) Transcript_21406:576-1316(+)
MSKSRILHVNRIAILEPHGQTRLLKHIQPGQHPHHVRNELTISDRGHGALDSLEEAPHLSDVGNARFVGGSLLLLSPSCLRYGDGPVRRKLAASDPPAVRRLHGRPAALPVGLPAVHNRGPLENQVRQGGIILHHIVQRFLILLLCVLHRLFHITPDHIPCQDLLGVTAGVRKLLPEKLRTVQVVWVFLATFAIVDCQQNFGGSVLQLQGFFVDYRGEESFNIAAIHRSSPGQLLQTFLHRPLEKM